MRVKQMKKKRTQVTNWLSLPETKILFHQLLKKFLFPFSINQPLTLTQPKSNLHPWSSSFFSHQPEYSVPDNVKRPIPAVPLTSVDDVVKSMTDFDLFGDWSNQMDNDQETGHKSPIPETLMSEDPKSPHMQDDYSAPSPSANEPKSQRMPL